MKNKVIALSLMVFGFSAVVQGHGLVLINQSDGNFTYNAGSTSGTVHSKNSPSGNYLLFPKTPTILSIKRSADYFPRALETYLIKMALKKKEMASTDADGNELVGILVVTNNDIKMAVGYRRAGVGLDFASTQALK